MTKFCLRVNINEGGKKKSCKKNKKKQWITITVKNNTSAVTEQNGMVQWNSNAVKQLKTSKSPPCLYPNTQSL